MKKLFNLVSPAFFDDSSSPKNWGSPFQSATQKFRSRSLSRNFLGHIIIFLIFIICCIFVHFEKGKYLKVFQINSPSEIFIDLNNNHIYDERNPFKIHDIFIINEFSDLTNDEILNDLTQEEKFFIELKAKQLANSTLKNKFVKIKNNELYIHNKNYKQILLDSNLVYDNNTESKIKVHQYIKSININDYTLYNSKTRKYHKFNCELGRKSKYLIVLKKSNLPKNALPCNTCILPDTVAGKPDKEFAKGKIKDTYFDKNIKIFFLDLNSIFKPSNNCNSSACKSLKQEIHNAQHSIDFAVYGIDKQPEIMKELESAAKRGVKIRAVIDYDKNNENYYKDTLYLKNFISDISTDKTYEEKNSSAIMHNKFFIFDNKKVWTGSANITYTDLTGFNANYSVLVDSKELARVFEKEFLQMSQGKFHTDKEQIDKKIIKINENTTVFPLFSPKDNIIENYIIPQINNAKSSINISIFFLTYKNLVPALKKAYNRGVKIRIINDATNAHSKYTIHNNLRDIGIKVKTENYAGKMHMKTIIIDDEITIIGSMNYTKSANNKNDENILIISNKNIAEYFNETFEYLWNKIPSKYEYYDPKSESFESIGSCFDGIDNDFDGKIDKIDEGCMYKNKSR